MAVIDAIQAMQGELTAWRHDFHAHPELAFEEHRTSDLVADRLASFGLEVHRGVGRTGVVGTLRRGSSGRRVGLRADMDALPIEEGNSFDHRSRTPGKMHACGHDGHTTMLLGAARYLAEHGNFDGTIQFIFQPAEEAAGGARVMLRDGLFQRFPVDSVFAMHNWPGLPAGQIRSRPGPMWASFDMFDIDVHGIGSHGAMPHFGRDPVVAMSDLIGALQTVVSRNVDPLRPAVVSVTKVRAGDAYNVVPDSAYLGGGVRCFLPEVQQEIRKRMESLVEGVCKAYGARGQLNYRTAYPALVNDREQTEFAMGVAAEVVGPQNVGKARLLLASEDFAFMLEKVPGCYLLIGNGEERGGCMIHNSNYDFNDDILPVGTSFWVRLAESFLPASG
jgi:amidohydrolase